MSAVLLAKDVYITGINARPMLNGTQGFAKWYYPSKARYGVLLKDGECVSLKASNLIDVVAQQRFEAAQARIGIARERALLKLEASALTEEVVRERGRKAEGGAELAALLADFGHGCSSELTSEACTRLDELIAKCASMAPWESFLACDQRNEQILQNQAKLAELGLFDLVKTMRGSKAAGKKPVAPREAPAAAAAPSRGSSRLASQPHVSYKPSKAVLPSDDEEEEEDDARKKNIKMLRQLKQGKQASMLEEKGGKKAEETEMAAFLQEVEARPRHKKTSNIQQGGRGFKCPSSTCTRFFDTAAEAIEHGAQECGIVGNGRRGRVYDERGRTPCLWDGCKRGPANPIAASSLFKGKWTVGANIAEVTTHEAKHVKADAPTGFVCPADDCEEAFPTSDAAWAHAQQAHGIERDACRCLWDGCGIVCAKPVDYRGHEGVHTGVYPFNCDTCNKGFARPTTAKICCRVVAACRCGVQFKGKNGKARLATHAKHCSGKAAVPIVATD